MTSRIVLETKYGKTIRATPQASGTTLFCRLPYTKKPSPIEPNSNPQRRDDVSKKRLTVKLRGRVTTPNSRRGRTLSSRAHGAGPRAPHGPLQRLLAADIGHAAGLCGRNARQERRNKRHQIIDTVGLGRDQNDGDAETGRCCWKDRLRSTVTKTSYSACARFSSSPLLIPRQPRA